MIRQKSIVPNFSSDLLETAREQRSGMPGLGGRPTMHPSWLGLPISHDAGPGDRGTQLSLDDFPQGGARDNKQS